MTAHDDGKTCADCHPKDTVFDCQQCYGYANHPRFNPKRQPQVKVPLDILSILAARMPQTDTMIDQVAMLSRAWDDAQDKLVDALIDYYEAEQVCLKIAVELAHDKPEEPIASKISMEHNS